MRYHSYTLLSHVLYSPGVEILHHQVLPHHVCPHICLSSSGHPAVCLHVNVICKYHSMYESVLTPVCVHCINKCTPQK